MDQFFNVQMNVQEAPKIQTEQPASTASTATSSGNTFNSVLQQALPKDTSSKKQVTAETSQEQQTDEIKNHSHKDSSVLIEKLASNSNQVGSVNDIFLEDEGINTSSIEIESANIAPQKNEQLLAIQQKLAELLTNGTNFSSNNQDSHPTIADGKADFSESTLPAAQAPIDSTVSNENFSKLINLAENLSSDKNVLNPPIIDGKISDNQNQSPTIQELVSPVTGTRNLTNLQGTTSSSPQISVQTITADPVVQQLFQATPQTITPEQESLFTKIQAIIGSGSEEGVLSIKNVTPSDNGGSLRSQLVQLTPTQTITLNSDDQPTTVRLTSSEGFTALEEGVFAPTLRAKQQLSGVRHDDTQQFYDAKTQPLNVLKEGASLSSNQQGDDMNQPGSGFNQPATVATNPETTSTFSLPGSATTNPLSPQTSATGATTLLPSGTLVQDQEVIQQLVERFQVNKRQLETKIQLKLHPVELGKMEIDLTVKEGSIRANVVAQSQHVQEIVERNLTKLKTTLEQQGFNVEEITVTNESEMVGEFDMFGQHLGNDDSSKFSNQDGNSQHDSPFILDDFQQKIVETNSGVNVKV